MCKTHELVIMIYHHTSFKDMKKELVRVLREWEEDIFKTKNTNFVRTAQPKM